MKKLLVKKILERPLGHDWSLQGFGMLRLYLSKTVRLHVWNSSKAVPNVSVIHTHPWHFDSHVIAGQIINVRYVISDVYPGRACVPHQYAKILCGMGGGIAKGELKEERGVKNLCELPLEIYKEGATYTQSADEIHKSLPTDGTVTIVTRRPLDDPDHAYVFWEKGDWVSAEPRKATDDEVMEYCQAALKLF